MTDIVAGTRTFNVENMLRCAVRTVTHKRGRRPAWSLVADAFGLGSQSSAALLEYLGLDAETGTEPTKQ